MNKETMEQRPTGSASNLRVVPGFNTTKEARDHGINCNEVYPRIIIGNGKTAQDKEYLQRIGVTHVLNAAQGDWTDRHTHTRTDTFTTTRKGRFVNTSQYFYKDTNIKFLGFRLEDTPKSYAAQYFDSAVGFIDEALRSNGLVFVHCVGGMSRSSTFVIAYLMTHKDMGFNEALEAVQAHRYVMPNEGFKSQLIRLGERLKEEREQAG